MHVIDKLLNALSEREAASGRMPSLPVLRDRFRFAHHPQHIAAEDFVDRLARMATVQELLRDVRKARDIFELSRTAADAVEVGTDADVIDAGRSEEHTSELQSR